MGTIHPTYITGTFHVPGANAAIAQLVAGQILRLEREPHNLHDRNAIAVYSFDRRLGFVPAVKARIIAPQMDEGRSVVCRYAKGRRGSIDIEVE